MKKLIKKIRSKQAAIGIIGLGYVGLPLVIRFAEEGFKVLGFDIDSKKVKKITILTIVVSVGLIIHAAFIVAREEQYSITNKFT